MKLTYRDKVILISVLVVAVWVAGFMLIIKPAFADMNSASKTHTEKVIEYENKKKQVADEENLRQQANQAYDDVSNIAGNFYGKLSTDDVAETIDTLLDVDNIKNDSLTISAYSSVALDKFSYSGTVLQTDIDIVLEGQGDSSADAAAANTQVQESTAETIPCYTVSFGYTCEFEDLKSFLDKLTTNNEKSLVVTSCTITDVNADEIEGTMTMNLMMLPQILSPEEMFEMEEAADSAAE
ncbi:hypothetical protein [Ruminococcus sp. Marseille-P6503]|uniref:hypothetical protein n=1 Tax=Ruminococcus sp. Marseille-P6503 TaxID=2364796 RepID=UPI000F52F248|nr:hypothetical protein [Ruminococcus sp. Marseille-P6503]